MYSGDIMLNTLNNIVSIQFITCHSHLTIVMNGKMKWVIIQTQQRNTVLSRRVLKWHQLYGLFPIDWDLPAQLVMVCMYVLFWCLTGEIFIIWNIILWTPHLLLFIVNGKKFLLGWFSLGGKVFPAYFVLPCVSLSSSFVLYNKCPAIKHVWGLGSAGYMNLQVAWENY
jgi:hypothetical protein